MNIKRIILLIEDKTLQYRPLKEDLESAGWEVHRAEDEASTWRELDLAAAANITFDVITLDLGLPPGGVDDPLKVGVPLAGKLRRKFPQTPILAYTSIIPASGLVDFERLLAALLPLRVSFIYQRKLPEDVSISMLLNLILYGFYILGPGTVSFLPEAIADAPDPLEKEFWDTLQMLGKGLADRQIGDELGLSEPGVRNRISNIKERLVNLELLPAEERVERRDLVEWYFNNRVRYRRP